MDICNHFMFSINKNYNFWKYKEVLELNMETVQQGLQWTVNGDEMRLSKSIDQRRKDISVFNHVEKLNKHPSVFINYLKTLAINKGMTFTIDEGTIEGAPKRGKAPNYKLDAIVGAKDLNLIEFERLSELKKQGDTTTEENFQVDKHYWQRYLVLKELEPDLLK